MIKYRKITDISFVTDTMSICRKTDIESADTTPNKHRGGVMSAGLYCPDIILDHG